MRIDKARHDGFSTQRNYLRPRPRQPLDVLSSADRKESAIFDSDRLCDREGFVGGDYLAAGQDEVRRSHDLRMNRRFFPSLGCSPCRRFHIQPFNPSIFFEWAWIGPVEADFPYAMFVAQ